MKGAKFFDDDGRQSKKRKENNNNTVVNRLQSGTTVNEHLTFLETAMRHICTYPLENNYDSLYSRWLEMANEIVFNDDFTQVKEQELRTDPFPVWMGAIMSHVRGKKTMFLSPTPYYMEQANSIYYGIKIALEEIGIKVDMVFKCVGSAKSFMDDAKEYSSVIMHGAEWFTTVGPHIKRIAFIFEDEDVPRWTGGCLYSQCCSDD